MAENESPILVSYEKVAALRDSATRRNTQLVAQVDEYENAYRLNYVSSKLAEDEITIAGMRLPVGTPIHIPSTGPALVDRFVEQVRAANPHVTSGPIMRGPATRERREALEALANYAMQRIRETGDLDLWENLTFSLALRGCAYLTVLFDHDEWPDDAEERARAWPFVIRSIHPSNIYLPAGLRWPYRWSVEAQSRYYGELRDKYPSWLPASKPSGEPWRDGDECEVLVYWDKDAYALFAGGTQVVAHRNPIGMVPGVFDFAGFGYQSMDDDPATQSIGLLHHSLSELQSEVRLRTMSDALWQQTVWPTLVGTWSPEELKAAWGVGAGRYLRVDDMTKEEPKWLEASPVSPQMLALLPQLRQSIQMSTYSEMLMGGASEASVRSGVQAGIQVGQARARVDKVRAVLERMAGRVLTLVAAWYEHEVAEPVKLGTRSVSPRDISGHDRFRVEFVPIDPNADATRLSTGLALLQANTISILDFLRDYKRDPNPEETFEKLLAEKLVLKLADAGALDQAIIMNMATQDRIAAAHNGMARGVSDRNVSGNIDALERGAPYGPRGAQGTAPSGGPAQYTAAGQPSTGQPVQGAPNG